MVKLNAKMPIGQYGANTIAFSEDGSKQYILTKNSEGEPQWLEIKSTGT